MRNPLNSPSAPLLQIADGIATITLNRPAQRNRLENDDLQVLLAHFAQVNEDRSVRVLVLTANTTDQPKPVFCAGFDIGGFDAQGQGATAFERVPEALAVLRPITICALNGSVYGGATDIVLACARINARYYFSSPVGCRRNKKIFERNCGRTIQ